MMVRPAPGPNSLVQPCLAVSRSFLSAAEHHTHSAGLCLLLLCAPGVDVALEGIVVRCAGLLCGKKSIDRISGFRRDAGGETARQHLPARYFPFLRTDDQRRRPPRTSAAVHSLSAHTTPLTPDCTPSPPLSHAASIITVYRYHRHAGSLRPVALRKETLGWPPVWRPLVPACHTSNRASAKTRPHSFRTSTLRHRQPTLTAGKHLVLAGRT